MPSLHTVKLALLTLLWVGLCTPTLTCQAQPRAGNNPSYAPPRPVTRAELVQLADSPLAGARTATALGPLVILSAPFVGLAVWMSGGSPGSIPDGLAAVSLAATLGVGLGVLAYGIARSRKIRMARAALALSPHVSLRSREASLTWRYAY